MQENNNQAEPTKAISNGRNKRRCSKKVSASTPQAPVCGLIEDTSVFTEKLSGQHNKGYVDNAEKPEVATTDSEVKVIANSNEQEVENNENSCACSEKTSKEAKCCKGNKDSKEGSEENAEEDSKYSGPSFEETKNTQKRTLEVSLKKVPHKSEKVVEKDAVSYSKVSASMQDKPRKRGVLSKIKSLFSKLFGKKTKHNKNFKNNKGGYKKNYSKGKRRNNFDKNGSSDKTRDNSYRPNNRRKNYNRRPNNSYNKTKAPAANKE